MRTENRQGLIAIAVLVVIAIFATWLTYKPPQITASQVKDGQCVESLEMCGEYIRQHHYQNGKLYPVRLISGELVPPNEPEKPSGERTTWMCRYHAARWLGNDPVTGERWAWDAPERTNP